MILALSLLLQADPAAVELEKLARAHATLETFRVAYEGRPHAESKITAAKIVCTIDRPRRRAHLLASAVEDGRPGNMHLLMEESIFRGWSGDGGDGRRFDLGAPLRTLHQETLQAEADLRKLLPPALAIPPDDVRVPGYFLDLSPLTADGEGGRFRFAIAGFSPGGRLPWARFMEGAELGDDPADAVFRLPGKTWRIDRATGCIRSLKVEAGPKAIEVVLASLDRAAEFPELKLPATFQELNAPFEFLESTLQIRAGVLDDLLDVFRGTWAGLPAEAIGQVPALLRRWVAGYADGLRTHRTRLWVGGYVQQLLAKKFDPDVLAKDAVRLAGTLLDSLEKGAEQERAQVIRDLNRLADEFKPAKGAESAKALDDAVRDATTFESLGLPAWTQAHLKELFLEELERAKPK